jgi:hypothetical protein
MERPDCDNEDIKAEIAAPRSPEQVLDKIRKALLVDGVRPAGREPDRQAERAAGADPYNSSGPIRLREPWSRR